MTVMGDTFPDFLKTAWRGKAHLLAGIAAGMCLAIFLMNFLLPQYEARMILSPPEQGSEERSLSLMNGNAQALQRMLVTSQTPRDYVKFQQTFREVSAARIFAKYQGILDGVNRDRIFTFTKGPQIATPEALSEYIKSHVTISPVGASQSVVLTYRHPDSKFSEKFLGHLHKITDEMIRNEARVQSENRIAYLQKALQDTYNPENRKALADLLMAEERQKMLITMDQPYAADIVEPPSVSFKPVWPKAGVIFPVCIFLGAAFGFLVFSLRRK